MGDGSTDGRTKPLFAKSPQWRHFYSSKLKYKTLLNIIEITQWAVGGGGNASFLPYLRKNAR